MILYLSNLKNWFLTSSALPQIFRPRLASCLLALPLALDKKSEAPSCQIPNFSSHLGMQKIATLFICLISVSSLTVHAKVKTSHFLSFAIPCYNCEKTIKETIRSVYLQNLEIPFEVICTDDGSTDRTKSILEYYAAKFPNFFVYQHEKNRGGGVARNTCTSHAKGDLIFNLDSDNVLVPNSVGILVKLIDRTGCDAACFNHARFFKDNFEEVVRWIYSAPGNILDLYNFSISNEPIAQGNYLYKKKCFTLVGGYPEDCGAMDTMAFGLALLAAGCKIAIMPDPQSFYWHRVGLESYYIRESIYNDLNLQKAFRNISEVFAPESLELFSSEKMEEFKYAFFSSSLHKSFRLASPEILNSLFKAYSYKKDNLYYESANAFAEAIEHGCRSEKIDKYLQEMRDLSTTQP